MATLFETTQIKNMSLANRSVRSATWEGLANEDGTTSSRLNDLMVELARGGVGLIITGLAYVDKKGQSDPWQLGIDRDECISGLSEMTGAVHKAGGKIAVQISHAGCHSDASLTGMEPIGPSVMENESGPFCKEMTGQDIGRMVSDFGHAALRAKEAGFDGIQLHGAHGFMMSQFLSPFYNKRDDDYGGSVTGRTRIVLEILQRVRAEVGIHYPVMVKLNTADFVDGGLIVDDMLESVAMLENAGIDAIELSGGLIKYSGNYGPARPGLLKTEEEEIYYGEAVRRYKSQSKVPLMLVGGIRSYTVVERLLGESLADYVSLCRPLIREPGLINRWKSGDTSKSTCLSDNLCSVPARSGRGLWCVVEEKLSSKRGK